MFRCELVRSRFHGCPVCWLFRFIVAAIVAHQAAAWARLLG